jgi:succinate-semialdehyde dehydrogenase/glutarate-semialdehyde dehydrogenase
VAPGPAPPGAGVAERNRDPIFQNVLTSDFRIDPAFDRAGDPVDIGRIEELVRPFIDGAPCGGSGRHMEIHCPSTEAQFATVACAGPDDVDAAVESAARCWTLWRGTPTEERCRRLRALADAIHEERHAIARVIAREQGKPYLEALSLEVLPALDHLRFLIHHARRYGPGLAVEPRHPFYAHKRSHYLYDSVGVIALVTPSPLPFAVPLIQTAAAVAMGNSVVLKPSEHTPLSGLKIGELCVRAGLPPGLVNVVPAVPEVAMHVVLHDRVDKVFVTGSFATGQSVMAMAGCAVRPVVLSLGGKHPSIVAGDADVRRAARGIVWGALANAGQNCGAVERVFVVEQAASLFMETLVQEVDRVTMGNSFDEGVDVGPMLSPTARDSVHAQVTEAVEGGAKLLRGGRIPDRPGYFYPPTVVLNPPLDCRLMRQETQGPVIPVVIAESLERALMLSNDTEYALTASGWTSSPETAERIMVGLQAGVVTINDVLYSYGEPASTWSGHRRSGMGQNHGTPGLREMSRQRFASFDPATVEAPLFAFPYDEDGRKIVERAFDYLNARNLLRRLHAAWKLLRVRRFRRRSPRNIAHTLLRKHV